MVPGTVIIHSGEEPFIFRVDGEIRELTEYDEGMVRNYIKGIKIYDDHFTVSFKAGIDIDIQR